jgi:hypothetical protein
MVFLDSGREKMGFEKRVEEIRFATSSNTCDNLDEAVSHPLDAFVEISIPFDFLVHDYLSVKIRICTEVINVI